MTPTEQQLIRSSWAAVEPSADDVAKLFYARLFQVDPRLSRLFRDSDMEKQRMVLMQTLGVVVRNIDRLDQIIPKSRHSAGGAPDTGSPPTSTRPSAALWCGPSSRASATRSPMRPATPGPMPTAACRLR